MDQNKNKETEEKFDFSDIVKSEPTISNSGNEEFDFSDIVKTDSVKKKEPSESSLGPSASEAPSTLYPGNNDSVEFRPYKQKALRVIKKVPLPDNDAPENSVDKVVKEATPLFISWANDPSLFDLAADKSRNDFYQKLLRERKVSVQEEGVIKDKLEDVFNNARQVMLVSKKLKENPADIDSRYSLAYHQNRMGNNKEALANYESIIANDKNYTNAYNGIAYIYGTSGNNLMAIDALDRGIENNPTDASLYLNRGTYKLRVKDDVSALKDYETAYKMAELSGDKNLMQEATLKRVQTWRNLERSQDKDVAQKYIDLLDNKDGQDDKTIDKEYFKEQADAETENYLKLAKENKKAAIEQEKHIRESILPKIQKGEPLTEQEQKMWESPSLASAELKGLERGLAIGEAMDELLKPLDYSAVVSHPIDSAKEYVSKAGETIEEGRVKYVNGFKDIAQGAERSFVDKGGFSQVGFGFLKSAAGLLESAGGIIMNFTPQGILFQKGMQLSGVAIGGEEVVNQLLSPMNSIFKPKGEAGKLGAEVIDNILQDVLVIASGKGIKYAANLIKKIKDKKSLTQKDVSTIVEAGSMLDDEDVYDIAEKNGLEVNLNKVEEAGGISDGTGASSAELINQKAYIIKESLKSIRPDLKEIIDEVPTDKVISDMNDRGMPISKSAMAKYFDKVKIGEINVKELSIEEKKRFDELSSMDPDFMTDEQFKELEALKIKKEPARVESERSVFDEPANPPIENSALPKGNTQELSGGSLYKNSEIPVEKRKAIDDVYEKPTIDFANELIDSGLFNSAGQILDWRADLSLSTAEITKGLNDIKNGVNSVPARKIIEAAKDIQDKGEINTIRGRGGNTVRSGIPLDEYFKAVKEKPMPEELEAMDIEKANNIKDHTASVINNEGINKDNFDTFVKENGWLYTPEEINRIKTYLDETTERERAGDAQSQTTPLESEPVGETKVQDEGQAIRERAKTAREELKAAGNEWWNEQQKLGIIAGKKGAWESAKTDLRVLDATYKYAKAQIELGAYTVEKFIKDMHDEFKIVFTNKDAENIFNKIEGINDKTENGAAAKLGIAKVMESTGVGSRKIFLATGWERGTDGNWNYELPDGDFKNIHNVVNLMLNPDGKDYNITDLFDAEDLYKAYPEIKNVNIKFIFDEKNKNEEAVYIKERASNKETIQINTAKFQTNFSKVGEGDILGRTNNLRGVRRLFTHELEHIVQDKEGFAKGGTPYNFNPELYKELAQKHGLLNKGLSEDQIKYELYRKLSGEVQARNAAYRLDLTNEEKANRPFSNTQEIGPAEQILSFADAEAYSQATSPESYNKLLDHTVNSIKEAIKDSDNKELEKNNVIDNIRNTRLYKQLSGEPDFNESTFLADIEEKIGGEKLTFENAKTKADEYIDDSKESKKRKFIQTVLGSDKTTEELKGATKELDQFYEGVSNKESIAKADRDIKANITQAEKDVFEAKGLDANVAVKGIRLIKHHESLGNWEEAVKIVDHLTTMGKKAGQGIQAFTLWNKLSPETIVKMSDKMMNEVNKKDLPKEVKEIIFKKMSDIGKMPEGVDKTEATMGVLNYIADQIPPTFKEKFDAFRYNNMLSNPLSHARNIYQGLFNTFLTRPLEMFAGSVYDYTKHPDNPSAREYQLADAPKHILSALTNIPNAWMAAKESFKKGYVADRILDVGEPKGMIENFRRSKTLRKYSVPTRLMESEDVFISTMLGQAEKTRLMDKGMSEKEANNKAKSLSEKFLYRNRALLNKEEMDVFSKGLENGAEAINKWRSRKDWVGYGTSWFVPFVMTPMRATQFALEFSPLGFAGGKFSKQKIARATLGSVAMGIGAMMAATDKTTWSAPEDKKERALFYDSGRKPYSVRIGDTWVPMQYFGPFGLSMAIPAAFKHHFKDSKEALNNNALDALGKATYGMGKYILETTPLANVGGMFKVLDGEGDYTLMNQMGFSAKQLFPYQGLIGYINKWKDKKYRKANGFFESLEKDIPFLSDDLDVYKTSDNKDAERGFESVLLPYATGANEPSMENKMIKRRKVVQQKTVNNQSEKKSY